MPPKSRIKLNKNNQKLLFILFNCLIVFLQIVFGIFLNLNSKTKNVFAININQETNTWKKLNIPKSFYTIEITPWGIYGANYNTSWKAEPDNSLFYSNNLGETWQEMGLNKYGVTDLAYDKYGNLYATNYYSSQNETSGLFKSEDKGKTWIKIGDFGPSASVETCGDNIMVGTYAHGLWISTNNGASWNQPDMFAINGPYLKINKNEKTIIVSNSYFSFISFDCGTNWSLINNLTGYVNQTASYNNIIIACVNNNEVGIYRSVNFGKSFEANSNWNFGVCLSITNVNGTFYANAFDYTRNTYKTLKSKDFGLNWEEIEANEAYLYFKQLEKIISKPSYIFALSPENGFYRYLPPPNIPQTQPFLGKLWERGKMSQQTNAITSYFDHTYPLLAYPYKIEPESENETITNFWGEKEKPPKLYYSSHDGIDFGLKYGTPIIAPASGYAYYSFTKGGGHTIKINHPNGYQTQYLHLQKDGLFVNEREKGPKWIEKGEQIGLVGLTGNTTGPHLHFAVRYDKNQNGKFDDEPDGRVDPYSWQDETKEDPWENYSWQDATGNHKGSESFYLWEELVTETKDYLTPNGGGLFMDQIAVEIPENSLDTNITLIINKGTKAKIHLSELANRYVEETAVKINAIDNFGNEVKIFKDIISITFNLDKLDLTDFILQTLKIMFFDESDQTWKEITSIIDEGAKTITGFTYHLSEFAVFGERFDSEPPFTLLQIQGNQENGWYKEFPTITLSSSDNVNGAGVEETLFSIDDGDSWEKYTGQTQIAKDGIYTILYRSFDKKHNWENLRESKLIKVDVQNMKLKDEARFLNGSFTINF